MNSRHFTPGRFWDIPNTLRATIVLFTLALVPGFEFTSGAATLTVTDQADSGNGTLREAITEANSGDTIVFSSALSGHTIHLTSGELFVAKNLTIDGSTLADRIVIDGNGSFREFEIAEGYEAVLNSLVLTNGFAPAGGGIYVDSPATLIAVNCAICGNSTPADYGGGGIFNGYTSTLTLNNCSVSNNFAGAGGAIDNVGALTLNNCNVCGNSSSYAGGIWNSITAILNNCTLSGNDATNGPGGGLVNNDTATLDNCTIAGNSSTNGGGIDTADGSVLTLDNCTISGNSAAGGSGGGIYSDIGGTLFLTNTIVAGNAASTYANIFAALDGNINNFIDGDPELAPLANYGGPTQTMPPLPGSPVIDAGTDSITNALATDQRGYPRLSGAHVDIGAAEAQFVAEPNINPPVLGSVSWSSAGNSTVFKFAFTNDPDVDFTALATTNLALPLANWTVVGNVPEISAGHYQFTDPGVTNSPQRFYEVVSP